MKNAKMTWVLLHCLVQCLLDHPFNTCSLSFSSINIVLEITMKNIMKPPAVSISDQGYYDESELLCTAPLCLN